MKFNSRIMLAGGAVALTLLAGCSTTGSAGEAAPSAAAAPPVAAAGETTAAAATASPSAMATASAAPSPKSSAGVTRGATKKREKAADLDAPGKGGYCGKLSGPGTKYLKGRLFVAKGDLGCAEAQEIFTGYLTKSDAEGSGHVGTYKGFTCGMDNSPSAKVKASCEKGSKAIEVRR